MARSCIYIRTLHRRLTITTVLPHHLIITNTITITSTHRRGHGRDPHRDTPTTITNSSSNINQCVLSPDTAVTDPLMDMRQVKLDPNIVNIVITDIIIIVTTTIVIVVARL